MRAGRATLLKLATANGLWTMDEAKAHVGKVYLVDLNSRQITQWHNLDRVVDHDCETILTYDEKAKTWLPFPTELLEIKE